MFILFFFGKLGEHFFIAARRQTFRLGREACFRYIIEVFCLFVCLYVCRHKWKSIYLEIPFIFICAEFFVLFIYKFSLLPFVRNIFFICADIFDYPQIELIIRNGPSISLKMGWVVVSNNISCKWKLFLCSLGSSIYTSSINCFKIVVHTSIKSTQNFIDNKFGIFE